MFNRVLNMTLGVENYIIIKPFFQEIEFNWATEARINYGFINLI